MSSLADLGHWFGSDLQLDGSGDLATVTDGERTRQRVLQRLLTCPGDYIWHPDYGAGLPRFVGLPLDAAAVSAVIAGQLQLEAGVAQQPAPVITVTAIRDGLAVNIRYVDSASGASNVLAFDVE
jgi:hypothetical protein